MPYLNPDQYAIAQPLFAPFDAYHLCVQTVLLGTSPGQVWVDDPKAPNVAFVSGSEGSYLAGDPNCQSAYTQLREVIPLHCELMVEPSGWGSVLGQVWKDIGARPNIRQHYLFRGKTAAPWRDRVPAGIRLVPIDAAFFEMDHLENHAAVIDWVGGWHSRDDFLAHGAGNCLVDGDRIASWSIMDCYLGRRCEIGIITAMPYRRQGLGSLVVAATVEACLAAGYEEIGWQCFRNNVGSIGVARHNGFTYDRDYVAYFSFIPCENAGDMTRAECEDLAHHYETISQQEIDWAFQAAQAWALAGSPEKALLNLRRLKESGWKGRREWFEHSWPLDSLRSLPEFEALSASLIED